MFLLAHMASRYVVSLQCRELMVRYQALYLLHVPDDSYPRNQLVFHFIKRLLTPHMGPCWNVAAAVKQQLGGSMAAAWKELGSSKVGA